MLTNVSTNFKPSVNIWAATLPITPTNPPNAPPTIGILLTIPSAALAALSATLPYLANPCSALSNELPKEPNVPTNPLTEALNVPMPAANALLATSLLPLAVAAFSWASAYFVVDCVLVSVFFLVALAALDALPATLFIDSICDFIAEF